MVYRVVLAVLLVLAVGLTLNERWQEQRAQALADRVGQPAGSLAGGDPLASSAARGSAAPRPPPPFVAHRVRARRELSLLQSPDPAARPVEGVGRIQPGLSLQAVDERDGWYLVDTNLSRGWAPTDAFDEP